MEKMHALIVIEMLGRPPEHVTEGMQQLLERLKQEKGVVIRTTNVHEVVPVEDTKDLFTTFAEIEIEVDSALTLFGIMFVYMPSHVEILSPEKVELSKEEMSDLTTKIMHRMHQYDELTKNALLEKEHVLKRLYEVAPHLFSKEPPKKDTSLEEKSSE